MRAQVPDSNSLLIMDWLSDNHWVACAADKGASTKLTLCCVRGPVPAAGGGGAEHSDEVRSWCPTVSPAVYQLGDAD